MTEAIALPETAVDEALAGLPGWSRSGAGLAATFTMPTFGQGIELVSRVAVSAEAANHHPDIDVRYRAITFRLTTHEVGAVTARDVNLAKRILAHARSLGWEDPSAAPSA